MSLSSEERERIPEEEWVRQQAREDFYKTNPTAVPGWGRRRGRPPVHPGSFVGTIAVLGTFVILADIASRIKWKHILP